MHKYIIITTFPNEGTKNIGDKLIEVSTKKIIEDLKGSCQFITFWRQDDLNAHLAEINSADAIIFACLAIRQDMFPHTYKLIDNLEKITIPMIVLSSGTSFLASSLENDPFATHINYAKEDKKKLLYIASQWDTFSCRGEITYNNLKSIGIKNAVMTGDVAFYDPRFDKLTFKENKSINAIAVSTPHYPELYAKHFYTLIQKLRLKYNTAKITIFVHGESTWIDEKKVFGLQCNIENIYKHDISSLDKYSDYDMHVGYRVHAHVSALKRRIPSYLFAIDGRAYDYGYTLHTGTIFKAWKISSKFYDLIKFKLIYLVKKIIGKRTQNASLPIAVNYEVLDYVIDLIGRDQSEGFTRFIGFETEILKINKRLKIFLEKL